ncbi:MAG: addiction module protein [Kiritimatiellae bacterium]|nr:addiction module protein [Kiritimatiellia bacterium]
MPVIKEAIDKMSTAERVQTMEYLWSVLSSYYDTKVPEWHANVLAERENAPEDEFEDWETAKKELRGEILAH